MRKFLSNEQIRKPKYVIPMLALPFLLILGYICAPFLYAEEKVIEEKKEGINAETPGVTINKESQDKLTAMLAELKRRENGDTIPDEYLDEPQEEIESPVTDNQILSVDNEEDEQAKALKALQEKYFGNNDYDESYRQPQSYQSDELAAIRAQLAHMDSVMSGQQTQAQTQTNSNILIAKKVNEVQNQNFHTLVADKRESFISAILDEAQTVVNGSRIRVRLLDDIFIGDKLLKQGEYLYGLVDGFSAQRVHVTISSVLYGNKILRCNLTIYDNDGIAGLYVPNSDFRQMMQRAGSQMVQQSPSINSGADDQFRQMMTQMGQDLYQSITQAMAQKIRQNKAKLKYATVVYLINGEEDIEQP